MESFNQVRIFLFPAPVELAALADHLILVAEVVPATGAEVLLYESCHFIIKINVFGNSGVLFYVFVETTGL